MPGPRKYSDVEQQIFNDMQRKFDSLNDGPEKFKALIDFLYLTEQIHDCTLGLGIELFADYLAPKRPGTNELDKEKARKRFEELMEFRVNTVYKGYTELIKENPGHSDKWYSRVFESTNKNYHIHAMLENNLLNTFDYIEPLFYQAFPELYERELQEGHGPCASLMEDGHKKAFQSFLDKLTDPEDKKCFIKAGQLMLKAAKKDENDPKYKEQQEKLKIGEIYPTRADEFKTFYESRRDLDISFLSNDILKIMLKDSIRSMDMRHIDYYVDIKLKDYNNKKNAMLQMVNEQSQKFNSTKSFWHINSNEYKEVKKKIKKLNEEIEKGGKVIDALEALEVACDKYLVKNLNKGKKELGKKRKAVISEIREFAKKEKAKMNSALTISEKWTTSVKAREDALNRNNDVAENNDMKKHIERSKTFGEKITYDNLNASEDNKNIKRTSTTVKRETTNQRNIKKEL